MHHSSKRRHIVDVLVTATVNGEAREFTRKIYVIAQNTELARQ